MIAAIVSEETFIIIEEINRRKLFELDRLTAQTAFAAQRSIEKSKKNYEQIVVEVDAIRHGNVEAVIDLVERLKTTTTATLVILAQGYDPDSSVVKDLVSVGVEQNNIVLHTGLWFKKRLQELLKPTAFEAGTNCPSPARTEPVSAATPIAAPIPEPSAPPSQIDRATAKKALLPKPPISQPAMKAITVAFAGAGSRIGTTTQAMQMLLFLVAEGYKAALVEMTDKSVLSEYISNSEFCPEHYKVNGLDLYRTRSSLLHAQNEYQYLILDYGPLTEGLDGMSFFEKNYKIICTGVKPQETAELAPIFDVDDGSFIYCFSFVPEVDKREVEELMRGRKIYFASAALDYWTFCGEDDTYRGLLDLSSNSDGKDKPGIGLFKRK